MGQDRILCLCSKSPAVVFIDNVTLLLPVDGPNMKKENFVYYLIFFTAALKE